MELQATATIESPNDLLKSPQAEDVLNLAPGVLRVWRARGTPHIPYYKIGRSVKYLRADLTTFVKSCRVGGSAA